MKRNYTSALQALFIVAILAVIYFTMMPQWLSKDGAPLSDFSSKRALEHVKVISQKPHYVGSQNHEEVASYLQAELQKLGLETQIQEGTTLSDWGNLVKSKNIIAKIKGTTNSKALVLLSHYDSAPHSYSYGAADDASGVAVIIESVRAFLHNRTPHKNDVIILFTDAEELGLNGAALFVTQSDLAKEVGLVLNFEARGTSGPSYMLMEVNNGNSEIVDAFSMAGVKYPVSNSLMYSIYKMLPNDTDLTVFREQGQIQGLNFAFIDDHFNYHTAQDDFEHLSEKSVAHQGSYLNPLLNHLSNSNLSDLNSDDDQIYFNTPFFFFHYPFSWVYPMLTIAIVLFLFLGFIGIGKRILYPREVGHGFLLLFGSLIVAGAVSFLGWNGLLMIYPQYAEIPQGFTYNGHFYIAAFIFLTFAILFLFYRNVNSTTANINLMVAPLLLWLILNTAIAVLLPGAGFFIIPVFFGLLMFAFAIITQRSSTVFNMICCIPALLIYGPFIVMLPIGLGLKLLVGSIILTVLVFSLLLPVFGTFTRKLGWSALLLLVSIGFFITAHVHSDYEEGKAKPNSLLYVYDADTDKAVWTTYDKKLDDWTKIYLTDNHKPATALKNLELFSKYGKQFTYVSNALVRNITEPTIEFVRDSIVGTQRHFTIRITPNRPVNRYDIFANENMSLHNLKANGATAIGQKGSLFSRKGRKVLSYYVVAQEPLTLSFSVPSHTPLDMELLESSFDLMSNPLFDMRKRPQTMMPLPFVLTDAVAVRKNIMPAPAIAIPMQVRETLTLRNRVIYDTIQDPDEGQEFIEETE